jgi:hypothetical protein
MAGYKTDTTGSEKNTRWDSCNYGNEESSFFNLIIIIIIIKQTKDYILLGYNAMSICT